MDPDVCYQEIMQLAKRIIMTDVPHDICFVDQAVALAERIDRLDRWIKDGGELPGAWRMTGKSLSGNNPVP